MGGDSGGKENVRRKKRRDGVGEIQVEEGRRGGEEDEDRRDLKIEEKVGREENRTTKHFPTNLANCYLLYHPC